MPSPITGIHHVTALAKDPLVNHDFYTRTLGLRLVKKTVNFDDPMIYHFYFGDGHGRPGTLLTHFPDPMAARGTHGAPEILETVLRVPDGALTFWRDRLRPHGAVMRDDGRLAFEDPDGMRLSMHERSASDDEPSARTGIDPDHAVRGVDGAVIHTPDVDAAAAFLSEVLGFTASDRGDDRTRLHVSPAAPGDWVELVRTEADPATRMGAGTVHHIAWRAPDDAAQRSISERIRNAGVATTGVKDRRYFRSIYFRIPGRVIFEIATDGPGFDLDEPLETLGHELKLPPQYEPRRHEIEARLVPVDSTGRSQRSGG